MLYSQKNSPVFLPKSPVYSEKSPVSPQKSPSFKKWLMWFLKYAYISKCACICAFIEKGDHTRANSCMCVLRGGGGGWRGSLTQRHIMWLTPVCVTWLVQMCDMTHSCMWYDSCMCVTRPIPMCDMLIPMCDMTHPYVWHDPSICVSHAHVWHDSFRYVTWIIRMCDMTHTHSDLWHDSHPHVWHDSVTRVTWRIDMTDAYVWQGYSKAPSSCNTPYHPSLSVTTLIHLCHIRLYVGSSRG